jgi:large subunit ribosomal protein L15
VGVRPDPFPVSLEILERLFQSGTEVSPKALAERGVVDARKRRPIKIVGGGELTKKLLLRGVAVTATVRTAIEKAGGSIE